VSAGMVAYSFNSNVVVLIDVIFKDCYCTHSKVLGYSVAEKIEFKASYSTVSPILNKSSYDQYALTLRLSLGVSKQLRRKCYSFIVDHTQII
jgi:hypothetical protein